jgi:hypothetical protein
MLGIFQLAAEQLAHADEGADNKHAHADRFGTLVHIGGHDGAVFSEGVGEETTSAVSGN